LHVFAFTWSLKTLSETDSQKPPEKLPPNGKPPAWPSVSQRTSRSKIRLSRSLSLSSCQISNSNEAYQVDKGSRKLWPRDG